MASPRSVCTQAAEANESARKPRLDRDPLWVPPKDLAFTVGTIRGFVEDSSATALCYPKSHPRDSGRHRETRQLQFRLNVSVY